MIEMVRQDVIPAVSDFVGVLCQNLAAKLAVSDRIPCKTEKNLIDRLASLNDEAGAAVDGLEKHLKEIDKKDVLPASQAMAHKVIPDMERVRKVVDEMETLTSSDYWPYPTYFDILYSVK